MSKFSVNFTSVGGETKAIPDTHMVFMKDWLTEVIEHLDFYCIFV